MSKKENKSVVKVFLRQRPLNDQERAAHIVNVVKRTTSRDIFLNNHKGSQGSEKKFSFDEVFDGRTSQAEVYNVIVSPLIQSCINGYNCTVFAYGQTGTGKTHTVIGDIVDGHINFEKPETLGLIPRAAQQLFQDLEKTADNIEYAVRVSFVELYNEEIRDLLTTTPAPRSQTIKIYEDSKGQQFIRGVKEITVCKKDEIYSLLQQAEQVRQTAATNCNRQSSRSHTVFTMVVHTREVTVDGNEFIKTGKLNLVDLAGSENIGRSGAVEARAREAGTINKSLLTLGKVIKAITEKANHIPYRESKLTRILQDSLGGKTKTCMIATISPSILAWDETLSTLDYATMARNVVNCPEVNINRKHVDLVKELNEEITKLRSELSANRTGEGFYITHEQYERFCANMDERQMLEVQMKEISEAFSVTRQQLKRVHSEMVSEKKKNKFNEFLLDYVTKHDDYITETAKQLIELSETLSRNESILHNNYENIFHKTIENMVVYQSEHELSANYSKSIQKSIDNFKMHSSKEREMDEHLVSNLCNSAKNRFKNLDGFFNELHQHNEQLRQVLMLKKPDSLVDYFVKMNDELRANYLGRSAMVDGFIKKIEEVSQEAGENFKAKAIELVNLLEMEWGNNESLSAQHADVIREQIEENRREEEKYASIEQQLANIQALVSTSRGNLSKRTLALKTATKRKIELEANSKMMDIRSNVDCLRTKFDSVQKKHENEVKKMKIECETTDGEAMRQFDGVEMNSRAVLGDLTNNVKTLSEDYAKSANSLKNECVQFKHDLLNDLKTLRQNAAKSHETLEEFGNDTNKFSIEYQSKLTEFNRQFASVERTGETPQRQNRNNLSCRSITERLPPQALFKPNEHDSIDLSESLNIDFNELTGD